MIEIIQEENWDDTQEKRGLPKNIKQIGTPDTGDRIYIENEVYQKLHPYEPAAEKMMYIMLGRFEDFGGHSCIFIEHAVEMPEIEFGGNLPAWTDDSWGHLYRKLKPEHEELIIVGWAVDICGHLPNMTAQLEHIHHSYFGGTHQILYLLDSLEKEETFYSNSSGYLKRRAGFYIYYDKIVPSRIDLEEEEMTKEQPNYNATPAYRKKESKNVGQQNPYTAEKKTSGRQEKYKGYKNSRKVRKKTRPLVQEPQYRTSYASTLLLVLVIAALGYSTFWNYKKADEMEQVLAQMNQTQSVTSTEVQMNQTQPATSTEVQVEQGTETVLRVEEIAGNVTPDTSAQENSAGNGQVSTQIPENQAADSQQQSMEQSNVLTQPETVTPPAATEQPETASPPETAETIQQPETTVQTAAETYLAQGYYIVQQGDNLAGICREIYHTTAMMDKVCELNEIENPDAIYAGQYLELPQ